MSYMQVCIHFNSKPILDFTLKTDQFYHKKKLCTANQLGKDFSLDDPYTSSFFRKCKEIAYLNVMMDTTPLSRLR